MAVIMFGISTFNISLHIGLNVCFGVISYLILGATNNAILFFALLMVLVHSFITDLLPHRTHGLKKISHIILEEFLPTIVVMFILSMLSKEQVPWRGVIVGLLLMLAVSLFFKGIFCVVNGWLHLKIAQLITSIIALIFLGGIFLLPSLLNLLESYETKNKIYLFFAQVNPLIVICNLFGLDPFHKDQLYQYFGSNFLVPKMDGFNSIAVLSVFAAIFWLVYLFWGKEKKIA